MVGKTAQELYPDDDRIRRVAARALEVAGYTVLLARDGEEGLAVARAAGRPIHLLVTDVVMPDMNGRELWDRLKRLRPDLKVLYMSGYTDDVIADRGALEPGAPLVGKPFTSDVLLRHVRSVLHGD